MENLIIILPLVGAIVSIFAVRRLGPSGVGLFLVFNMSVVLITSIYLFYFTGIRGWVFDFTYGVWLDFFWGRSSWGFWADNITALMSITVSAVSLSVHIYSLYYMENDPYLPRFLAYLSLFSFFMLFLVGSENLIQLFFGWEGVGLCSYLLINFWYTRPQANKSALKAIIVNRIGDCALLIAISLLVNEFGSIHLQNIFVRIMTTPAVTTYLYWQFSPIDLICALLFIGVAAKSAQIGLHMWLPDAMEGPTPVSALIHAATMVTAGIYLLIRTAPLFEYSAYVLMLVALVGGLTAFFAASTALAQYDLKKIIAYSTCSQLGYMVMACGISHFSLALFHLVNHAFFKALLFLGAGVVIHCFNGEQDIRRMGGLQNIFPTGLATMGIASAALSGIPFLAGFYSKDFILSLLLVQNDALGVFLWIVGFAAALCTAIYSISLIYYIFYGKPRGTRTQYCDIHAIPWLAKGPLVFLSCGSIFSGFVLKDMLAGVAQPTYFSDLLFFTNTEATSVFTEWVSIWFKVFMFSVGFTGVIYYYGITRFNLLWSYYMPGWVHFYKFLAYRWYWDHIYNVFIAWPVYRGGYLVIYRLIDKGVVEGLGLNSLTSISLFMARMVALFQSGSLSTYLSSLIISFFIFFEIGFFIEYF